MFKEGLAYVHHNHHDELFTLLEANDNLRLCHLLNQPLMVVLEKLRVIILDINIDRNQTMLHQNLNFARGHVKQDLA